MCIEGTWPERTLQLEQVWTHSESFSAVLEVIMKIDKMVDSSADSYFEVETSESGYLVLSELNSKLKSSGR